MIITKDITITNEDNMALMSRYEDNYFDLAIVDPPYGLNIDGQKESKKGKKSDRKFHKQKQWDSAIPSKKYFIELQRISKNQIIWGANYFLDYLKATPCYLVWDKKMTEKHLMSMSELAWTSFKTKNLIFKQPPVGDRGFYNIDGKRIHPTQKSIKLYEWLLINYANEGDKILDTHLGSGSIAIACHNLGYDLTGYEIDKEYFEAAQKRIKEHQSQLRIL